MNRTPGRPLIAATIIVTVVLTKLKLVGVIDWPWTWILVPPVVFCGFVLVVVGVAMVIAKVILAIVDASPDP